MDITILSEYNGQTLTCRATIPPTTGSTLDYQSEAKRTDLDVMCELKYIPCNWAADISQMSTKLSALDI